MRFRVVITLCLALALVSLYAASALVLTTTSSAERRDREAARTISALQREVRELHDELEVAKADRATIATKLDAVLVQLAQLGVAPVVSPAPSASESTQSAPSPTTPPSTNTGGQEPPGQQPERCTVKVLGLCI